MCSFASLEQAVGVSGTGSCDLLAHVDDSGGPLRLFFTTNEDSASMGIEVGGVIERAAGVHFVLFILALIVGRCKVRSIPQMMYFTSH